MTVTARAVALINASGIGGGSSANCILALGNSAAGGPADLAKAITSNGNARLNLQGCSIGTNSSANGGGSSDAIYFGSEGSSAINLIETNSILGGRVSAVGGASIVANCSSPTSCTRSCTSVSGSPSSCTGGNPVTPVTTAAATPNPICGRDNSLGVPGDVLQPFHSCQSGGHCLSVSRRRNWFVLQQEQYKRDPKSGDLLWRNLHLEGKRDVYAKPWCLYPGQHQQ